MMTDSRFTNSFASDSFITNGGNKLTTFSAVTLINSFSANAL